MDDLKKLKLKTAIGLVVIAVIITAALSFSYFAADAKDMNIKGNLSNISDKPNTCPIILVKLSNPNDLSNPYNVTITLNSPIIGSVSLRYIGYKSWESGSYFAIVNLQSSSLTDFVISSGTEIAPSVNSSVPFDFAGTTLIITYSGYNGALTYTIA